MLDNGRICTQTPAMTLRGKLTASLSICAAIVSLGAFSPASAAPSAPSASDDPMYGAPEVGACFAMSTEELSEATYSEAPVECTESHTTVVMAIAKVPKRISMNDMGALYTEVVQRQCSTKRHSRYLRTQPTTLALTSFEQAWFRPTRAQIDAGARWVRCDLYLWSGKRPLALNENPRVRRPIPAKIGRCLSGNDWSQGTCNRSHRARATGAVQLAKQAYPSRERFINIGGRACRTRVTSDAFRFTWPSELAWKGGHRIITCFTITRR